MGQGTRGSIPHEAINIFVTPDVPLSLNISLRLLSVAK
jgi:hypothetical protein